MKICDLDHLELMPPKANSSQLRVTGGIGIEVLTISLSLGDAFALAKTFSYTFAYAPPPFKV